MKDLDEELAQQPGFKAPLKRSIDTTRTTSTIDLDCGYINHGKKRGVGYLAEVSMDCKKGIVTGLDVFPANEKESLIVLWHLEKQMAYTGLPIGHVALDRGYDTGAVHRGLEPLGITGYTFLGSTFPTAPRNIVSATRLMKTALSVPWGIHSDTTGSTATSPQANTCDATKCKMAVVYPAREAHLVLIMRVFDEGYWQAAAIRPFSVTMNELVHPNIFQ